MHRARLQHYPTVLSYSHMYTQGQIIVLNYSSAYYYMPRARIRTLSYSFFISHIYRARFIVLPYSLVIQIHAQGLVGTLSYSFIRQLVRYHCGGWPEEVNSCFLNSYMVYL
jgi:hypothetical protein